MKWEISPIRRSIGRAATPPSIPPGSRRYGGRRRFQPPHEAFRMGSSCNIRTRINPHSPREPCVEELALRKSVASGKLSVNKPVTRWVSVQAAMVLAEEAMAGHYHHTQLGTLMLTTLLLAALLTGLRWIGILATLRSGQWPWLLFVLSALCCGLAWVFSSLTLEVTGTEIRWYFGPGLWDYRVA